jgi:hypothetical protein
MTPAMEAYDEVDGVEGFDDFESTAEAIPFPFRPGVKVFAPGGLSTATLQTPKGPAKLTMPSPVPTLAQFRTLEQALNANTQRVNAVNTELARVRRELALRRRDPQGQNMMPLLLTLKLSKEFKGHTHDGAGVGAVKLSTTSDTLSSFLPLLMFMPNLFGGNSALSGAQSSTASDAMSPLMLMILMEAFD